MSKNLQTSLTEAGKSYVQAAPQWATVIMIVAAFLFYLYLHEKAEMERDNARRQHEEMIAEQRIETCHDVQDRSIQTMDSLSRAMFEQAKAFHMLSESFRDLERAVREQR